MEEINKTQEICRLLTIDITELDFDILELQISRDFLLLQLEEEKDKLNQLTSPKPQEENTETKQEEKRDNESSETNA